VTTSTDIAPRKNANELAARIGWAALICATLYVCYFSHLGAIGFVGPDEPRYAWIARDMAETGDWVTPRLYGKPWFEKPPLYYWGAAICFKLFGVSEAAARLPSAISALLATLAMAWLAWHVYGAETAGWLLLLLPTTVGMIGFSHAAATDMPFSAMLTIAMVCAAVIVGLVPERSGQDGAQHAAPLLDGRLVAPRRWLAPILFGFFLGLAVLAKGPAGIILCGGAVFFWALFTKRWRDALRLLHPAAIAAFCLTALPWYILCARRNADFFRIFIIEHNFKRYLTPEFQHIQPFWFYGPIILLACLPWTLLLFPAIGDSFKSAKRESPYLAVDSFLASWAVFSMFFFTASNSKLPGYILPAVPALLLLGSRVVCRSLKSDEHLHRAVLFLSSIASAAMILIIVRYTARFRGLSIFDDFGNQAEIMLLGLRVIEYVVALAAPLLISFRRSHIGMICALSALVGFLWSGGLATLPQLDRTISPRTESLALADERHQDEQVLLCGMPRSFSYGYSFYLRRELTEWDRISAKPALVIVGPACFSELKNPNYRLQTNPIGALLPFPVIRFDPHSAADMPGSGKPQ
jgi:4-amino-4-deoxy-L-arabinose transferase-like glycosyltransferase